MSQCKAHSKRTGEPCRQPAMVGRDVCRLHGGKSLRGVDSPTFKHGRYSRAFQAAGGARFAEILTDPELLSTRAEIAALTVRLESLIARAEDAKPAAGDKAWSQIIKLAEALSSLRNTELRRLEKLQGFMTLEQAQALARALAVSVRDRVASGLQGQVLIDAIHGDIRRALPAPALGDAQGG